MRSKYSTRSPWTERLEISLSEEQKARAFAVADRKNISVGALIRQAIDTVTEDQKQAA